MLLLKQLTRGSIFVWTKSTGMLIEISLIVKEEHEMLEDTNDDEPIKAKKRK